LPALKCGTFFSGTSTFSPVLRWPVIEAKPPNPRISIRCPFARVFAIASNRVFTANSTILEGELVITLAQNGD
jgi:hypothetical protein